MGGRDLALTAVAELQRRISTRLLPGIRDLEYRSRSTIIFMAIRVSRTVRVLTIRMAKLQRRITRDSLSTSHSCRLLIPGVRVKGCPADMRTAFKACVIAAAASYAVHPWR